MNRCLSVSAAAAEEQLSVCDISREDFVCQALKLLPPGTLWEEQACTLRDIICAVAGAYWDQWQRICCLEREVSPCTAVETLGEWIEILAPECLALPELADESCDLTSEQNDEIRELLCDVISSGGQLTCGVISREVARLGLTVTRCVSDCETVDEFRTYTCGYELGQNELGLHRVTAFEVDILGLDEYSDHCRPEKTDSHCSSDPDTRDIVGYHTPDGSLRSTRAERIREAGCLSQCPGEDSTDPEIVLEPVCDQPQREPYCSAADCQCHAGLGAWDVTENFRRLKNPYTLSVFLDPVDFPCEVPMGPGNLIQEGGDLGIQRAEKDCPVDLQNWVYTPPDPETQPCESSLGPGNLIPAGGDLGVGCECGRTVSGVCIIDAMTPAHMTINYYVECN